MKRWLGIGGAALIAVVAITPLGRTVREERIVAGERVSRAKTAAAAIDHAAGAMARHPADYYVPAAVANALFRLQDKRAVGFANHALTLHPTHAGLHRLAARMLESARRPAQACLEWRHAIEYAENPRPVIVEMSRHRTGGETVARCVPSEGIPRPEILVMELERIKNPEAALLVARRAAEAMPKRERLLRHLGRLELLAGNLEPAQAALAAAQEQTETTEGAKLLAEVLAARGKFADAEKIILSAADAATGEAEKILLLGWLAEQMSLRKRHTEAKELLSRSLGLAGSDRKLLAAVHFRLARVERDLGNLHQAQWEEAKARELTGP